MSDNELTAERISALQDGELDEAEADRVIEALIGQGADSAELQRRWENYHLISDALSNNLPSTGPVDIAGRVAAAIADEPVVLAPRRSRWSPVLKPLAGLAIAASVATVAVIGVQQSDTENGGFQSAALTETLQSGPVSLGAIGTRPVTYSDSRWSVEQPSVERRLNGYLVNHNELADRGIQGMLPYVRIVTYGSGGQIIIKRSAAEPRQ